MGQLFFKLLGPPQIMRDNLPIAAFEYNKVRALLIYLVVEREVAHSREHLIGLLWPDLPERVARQNLSQALLNLREAIGDRSAEPPFLIITRDTLQFNLESQYDLDVSEFTTLLETCERHTHRSPDVCPECAARLQQAVTLYRHDFLAQFFLNDSAPFEEWLVLKREAFHQHALTALAHLTHYYERRAQYEPAAHFARRQLELEPWREETQRQLMRVLALSGQRTAALRQYDHCCRALQEAMNLQPEAATTQLYERIRDSPDSRVLIPQIAIYRQPLVNLPTAPTPLLGREQESAAVQNLLQRDEVRLITLTGAPGIGKTRLGLAIAARLRYDFDDGVYFIPLAAISDPAGVLAAIVHTLDAKESGTESSRTTLIRHLREKQILLLLDNFEQVLDAAPDLAEVLAACPQVKMIVTSRAALHIRAERQYPLAPLSGHDAIALFVERTQAIRSDFQLSEDNVEIIRSICARLDGLPLAIELIAARSDVMPLADLAAQLDRRLALLTEGPRDLPQRQRTLRNALEWSYNLLAIDEQILFARLGVFVGGCTREAIEAVGDLAEFANIDETLSALIRKSLVHVPVESNRYMLLETIREYALEQLTVRGETHVLQQRHAGHFLALSEIPDDDWQSSKQPTYIQQLERDHDNLRAALTWAHQQTDVASELRLAGALWKFWDLRGYLSEGRKWLEAAIARSNDRADELIAARAVALEGAATLATHQDDFTAAHVFYEQALKGYHALQHNEDVAAVLNHLGVLARRQGDYLSAVTRFMEALRYYEQLEDELRAAWAQGNLGEIAFDRSDLVQARAIFEKVFETFTRLNNQISLQITCNNLASVKLHQGEYGAAQHDAEQAIALSQQIGARLYEPQALVILGKVLFEQGDTLKARSQFEESWRLSLELGDQRGIAEARLELGNVAVDCGDWIAAHAYYVESLAILKELQDKPHAANALQGLAQLALKHNRLRSAARLLAAVEVLREVAPITPLTRVQYNHDVAALRAQLGEATFAEEWAQGRALTFEQAIAYALQTDEL